MPPATHAKLLNALTEFDRKEAKKKHHNRYALGQYCAALQSAELDVAAGATVRQALLVNFLGHLLSALLRSIGESDFTKEEMRTDRSWPRPDLD